ncbi:ESSS subunit of NADH:ubiquinone oxidoreductase-domain-containing protein [Calycina marina]|uniref:NADH dehydrogenase [ubiquinone] 1 beta subcomplex subunit 11, mitochondrial n=1 Tax=Calycina marina TaxID=1763456 RepID=A0A9P7YW41_9HELO|nr:ESSS subunit of NADH:ubiquinone oxidoreductase-domain-containing protein [Calycina marina]
MARLTLIRAANTLSLTPSRTIMLPSTPTQCRYFSSTTHRAGADHGAHEDHYDPPGGWLWGIKPGEKPKPEGWETIFYVGMFGSLGLAAVAYAFKPDTSIQTWALEEARRRLEVEGILKEPESKS